MKKAQLFFVMFATLIVTSCTPRVNVEEKYAGYSTLRPSVSSFADMNFTNLSLRSDIDFVIDESDPTFDFGQEGVSYFKAFELPSAQRSYRVVISSYQYAVSCLGCGSAYFYQVISMLDEAKQPIASTGLEPVQFVLGGSYRRELAFTVNPGDAVKYIVVHTTQNFVENGDTHTQESPGTMLMVSPGIFVPVGGGAHAVTSKGLPTGRLNVDLRPVG